ncbi:MAG: AbrB/MazE/SpoVT family DNA-binding domain-containing protein [Nanoarchaeota archaeon]|nr:AbrB/MazE/SpoVT family DNA-binding domain-containing protein [Nanoarchaeota archaeon]MBU1004254.1 AbrB/MazE/SpoVT family DNA-binding domain-containing protein [Nanoarchaeota archaeon]MBU1945414.1 AbrB/MazE/SpoVT family DNA-binding domain-containing protein [Nanoarchaeota archaeon]
MEIIKTSSRGQIVIPEEVRKRYKIKEGTRLVMMEEGGKLILELESKVSQLIRQRNTNISKIKGKESLNLLMASEKVLAKDWLSKEDDKAWKNL